MFVTVERTGAEMTLHAGGETLHLTPYEARRIGVALALLAHEAAEAELDG